MPKDSGLVLEYNIYKTEEAILIASFFLLIFFFALLVHLERFGCQLKRTVSNVSQAAPPFISSIRATRLFILEATSKPFDTAEKC